MSLAEDLAAYEADALLAPGGGDLLTRITARVRDLRDARQAVLEAEAALKAAQDRARVIEEVDLPAMMSEAGQQRLRTTDGYDLELGETLRASIPAANTAAAVAWLEANGQGSIVKREIKMLFGRGEDARADAVLTELLERGETPSDRASVHAMTLAAAIREMLAAGVDVPMALLGAHVQPRVTVKEARRK